MLSSDYNLQLSSNSPVITGGVVQFEAKLYYGNELATGYFKFYWEDNALSRNTRTVCMGT